MIVEPGLGNGLGKGSRSSSYFTEGTLVVDIRGRTGPDASDFRARGRRWPGAGLVFSPNPPSRRIILASFSSLLSSSMYRFDNDVDARGFRVRGGATGREGRSADTDGGTLSSRRVELSGDLERVRLSEPVGSCQVKAGRSSDADVGRAAGESRSAAKDSTGTGGASPRASASKSSLFFEYLVRND